MRVAPLVSLKYSIQTPSVNVGVDANFGAVNPFDVNIFPEDEASDAPEIPPELERLATDAAPVTVNVPVKRVLPRTSSM